MEIFNNLHILIIITALLFAVFKLTHLHDYMFSMPHIRIKLGDDDAQEPPKSYIWYWLDFIIPILVILITSVSSSYFLALFLIMNKHYFYNIEKTGTGSSNIFNFHIFLDIVIYILILLHVLFFKMNEYSILEHIILKL